MKKLKSLWQSFKDLGMPYKKDRASSVASRLVEKLPQSFNKFGENFVDRFYRNKVRKEAKIRNRYNQVPHMAQDITWESDITQLIISDKN